MDKTKAVLEVSVKAAEFIQAELQAAGLTMLEVQAVAECVLAASKVSCQSLIFESRKVAQKPGVGI